MKLRWTMLAPFLAGLLLGACKTDTTVEPAAPTKPAFSYYRAPCGRGEPVEVPLANPVEVPSPEPKCADLGVKEGDGCTEQDTKCVVDPAVEGEFPAGSGQKRRMRASFMVCRAKPFDPQPCPMSVAAVKKDIHYLSSSERAAVAADVRDLRAVRYRYKSETDDASPTVGFIIDDAPNASFVDPGAGRVNVYSYATAIAITVQEQEAELAALRRRIEQLERPVTSPARRP